MLTAMKRRQDFSVMVFNVWMRPGYFPDGQLERAQRLTQELASYDVDALVFCEVFQDSTRQILLDGLAEHFPYRSEVLGTTSKPRWAGGEGFRLGNGGVVVLSRFPIEREAQRYYRGVALGPDAWSDKGVLYTRIRKHGEVYNLLASHIQAAPESFVRPLYWLQRRDVDQIYCDVRMEQYAIMRRFAVELGLPAHEPLLMAGDLNTDRLGEPEEYRMMLGILDAEQPERELGCEATIDPRENPLCTDKVPAWLDYVLYSRSHLQPIDGETEVVAPQTDEPWRRLGRAQTYLSDHHAVIGRFVFPAVQHQAVAARRAAALPFQRPAVQELHEFEPIADVAGDLPS
jgi:sphingomyelin phosphodiesterase